MQSKFIQPNITQCSEWLFKAALYTARSTALGSPQCRNSINTNRNNEHARIPNTRQTHKGKYAGPELCFNHPVGCCSPSLSCYSHVPTFPVLCLYIGRQQQYLVYASEQVCIRWHVYTYVTYSV